MSSLLYCLIGDSNVKRHMNPTNCRDRPPMLSAQVLICNRREVLAQSLRSMKRESTVCILSCITNFLTSSEDDISTISLRVDPILIEFFESISSDCVANPDRRYLVCPPMYRRSPLWYRDNLAVILSRFSAISKCHLQPNMAIMPSFPSPAFEADGVHLTAYSGMEFVLHLFDSSVSLFETLSSTPDVRESIASESARLLEDRMMAIEQDHRRLNNFVELKSAKDAELQDLAANERMLDSLVISGLASVQGRLSGKEWQDRAQADVKAVLKLITGKDYNLRVVRNATGMAPNAPVTYTVEFFNTQEPAEIRAKFGTYFSGGKDSRPPGLSSISVQNSVTKGTRIRISIMKLIAKRYLAANPDAKAQVIGYNPRPVLKLTPSPSSKDRRIRSFNFIEAIQKFPTTFTDEEIGPLTKRAYSSFPNQLRSVFVVLSDDFPGLGSRSRSKRAASPSGLSQGAERRVRIEDDSEAN